MHVTVMSARVGGGVQLRGNYGCISVQNEPVHDYKYTNKLNTIRYLYINMSSRCAVLYRSCIALFYRKRLPQQQGDRRIGERETSMH
jgi:hypothetical protein